MSIIEASTTHPINEAAGKRYFAEVSTTVATVTVVEAISLPTAGTYHVTARITGHNTTTDGESVGYTLKGAFHVTAAGVVTELGTSVKDSYEHANSTDCDVSWSVAVANLLGITVAGEAGPTNYDWTCLAEVTPTP